MMSHNRGIRGFGAVVAIIVVALGALAVIIAAEDAAAAYADRADRRQERIQKNLDDEACGATAGLIRAKDAFASGSVEIPEFNCTVSL